MTVRKNKTWHQSSVRTWWVLTPPDCFLGNVVWLDDNTSIRALINSSRMPDEQTVTAETERTERAGAQSKGQCAYGDTLSRFSEGSKLTVCLFTRQVAGVKGQMTMRTMKRRRARWKRTRRKLWRRAVRRSRWKTAMERRSRRRRRRAFRWSRVHSDTSWSGVLIRSNNWWTTWTAECVCVCLRWTTCRGQRESLCWETTCDPPPEPSKETNSSCVSPHTVSSGQTSPSSVKLKTPVKTQFTQFRGFSPWTPVWSSALREEQHSVWRRKGGAVRLMFCNLQRVLCVIVASDNTVLNPS